MDLITFDDALAIEPETSKRKLLLGNGFSIACRPEIFTYDALFDRAEFAALDAPVRGVFDALDSRDFEHVMRSLQLASAVLRVYDRENEELATRLETDAADLREVLVGAIADSHPAGPFELEEYEYASARAFLANFSRVYTLSYDLLLYWTAMQDVGEELSFDDGFRTPDTGPADYVTWDVEKTDTQNAFYLHGALHLFDAGHEIKKYTWINTGVRLIDQVREALNGGLFPLIVSEGHSEQKLASLNHSNYLSRGYRSFAKIGGVLYTFGVAFSPNDDHILSLIAKNRVSTIAAAVYDDPDSEDNARMIARLRAAAEARDDRSPLDLHFFNAESAHVWDSQEP